MKLIFTFILILLSSLGFSQIVFNKTNFDFGKIHGDIPRFVDFYATNKSDKPHYILSIRKPDDITTVLKTDYILPDSTTVIRVQIDKNTLGDFSYQIPIYTSDKKEATTISLKGKIETVLEENNFMACPNFDEQPAQGNPLDFLLTVKIIDQETKLPIPHSNLAILQNGNPIGKWNLEKNSSLKMKIPLGISYFYASHPNYHPTEIDKYVNFQNNLVVLELEKKLLIEEPVKEEELIVIKDPDYYQGQFTENTEEITPQKEPEKERIIYIDEDNYTKTDIRDLVRKEENISGKQEIIPQKINELESDDFSSEYFEPINVIFVLDVSSSMKLYGRLDLLKYALQQLTEMLRPEDKIGLVTYATNAFVLLPSISGDRKEEITKEVNQLKASGLTAGEAGIKLGYKQVKKNFLKSGKNHLIIVTDGGFNRNSGNYKKFIEKNVKKKDITMSVIAIKANENALKNLQEATDLGKGRLLLIDSLADAQENLKQEIRWTSFRFKEK